MVGRGYWGCRRNDKETASASTAVESHQAAAAIACQKECVEWWRGRGVSVRVVIWMGLGRVY